MRLAAPLPRASGPGATRAAAPTVGEPAPYFGWPPDEAARPEGFVRIETAIAVEVPVEILFGFVTTPALWVRWHPATVAVDPGADHPLGRGESCVEHIRTAGRSASVRWQVLACERPWLWVIAGDAPEGSARIVYRFETEGSGCRFHRTLDFRSHRPFWRRLDGSLLAWALRRQSSRALERLKRVAERLER